MRNELLGYAAKRRIRQGRLLRRFEIMALVRASVAPSLCAWYLGCSLRTVRRWSPFVEQAALLLDKGRPGRPSVFSEAIYLRVTGFYCQNPLAGCRGWSLSWAATYLNQHLEILGRTISRSTIHRILGAHSLRPHRVKYFLHISDPLFFPKMERLIQLYLDPPQYLFCLDECTGLQALERVGPSIVADDGIKMDFEYKRLGTRDLYAILEVRSGTIFGTCTDNHREETLIQVFTEHVEQQPKDATLHYVCDNLANHSSEPFCRTVAELSGVPYPSLKLAAQRKQWLQSEEKRIVFHFTPYHGSWLNLVEIWFGILHSKCLKGTSFDSVDKLATTLDAFCATWNEHFAHPFRWTYRGEGLAEKVVSRLIDWLLLRHREMDRKFLHKQLQLINNLVRDYWPAVPRKRWHALLDALLESMPYVHHIIHGHMETQRTLEALLHNLPRGLGPQSHSPS